VLQPVHVLNVEEAAFRLRVIREVQALRPGEVVSYGEIARRVDAPFAARAVGQVLAGVREEGVPWWLVVTVSGRLVPGHVTQQMQLLREDGIELVDGRVPKRQINAATA